MSTHVKNDTKRLTMKNARKIYYLFTNLFFLLSLSLSNNYLILAKKHHVLDHNEYDSNIEVQERGGVLEYSLDFNTQSKMLIIDYFPHEHSERILKHGCWCGKLDHKHDNAMNLGGAETLDPLDDICRRWFRARYLNDRVHGGSCRDSRSNMHENFYIMHMKPGRRHDTICLLRHIDNNRKFNTCEIDDCEIDRMHLFMIDFYIHANPGYHDDLKHILDDVTCVHHEEF